MFVQKLKSVMAERHMSQTELAQRAGLTKASVSQYVNGRNMPRGGSMTALAEALDVPEEWLKGSDDESVTITETVPRRLTPTQAGRLMGVCPEMIRINLQNGRLPFGYALKGTRERFRYFISTRKFMEYTGMDEQDVLDVL